MTLSLIRSLFYKFFSLESVLVATGPTSTIVDLAVVFILVSFSLIFVLAHAVD